VRASNRFSMPVFPASFSLPISSVSSAGGGSSLSPCRPVVPMPRCGVAVTVAAAEAARRLHGERRPCSDVVTTGVSDRCEGEPLSAARSRSVGALVSHDLPPPPSPPPPPQDRLTLGYVLADLQTILRGLHGQHACLQALTDQLTAVDQMLKVINYLSHVIFVMYHYRFAVTRAVILTAVFKEICECYWIAEVMWYQELRKIIAEHQNFHKRLQLENTLIISYDSHPYHFSDHNLESMQSLNCWSLFSICISIAAFC